MEDRLNTLSAFLNGHAGAEIAQLEGVSHQAIYQRINGPIAAAIRANWPDAPARPQAWRWFPQQALRAAAGHPINAPRWIELPEAADKVFDSINQALNQTASRNHPDYSLHYELVAWLYDSSRTASQLEAIILRRRSSDQLRHLALSLAECNRPTRPNQVYELVEYQVTRLRLEHLIAQAGDQSRLVINDLPPMLASPGEALEALPFLNQHLTAFGPRSSYGPTTS